VHIFEQLQVIQLLCSVHYTSRRNRTDAAAAVLTEARLGPCRVPPPS
jgi:hypothetical protein